MTEYTIVFLTQYRVEIVYSILAVGAFLIIFYMIMAMVMVGYFKKYKGVLYASEALLKELYKLEDKVEGLEEFRDTVRSIRKISKSQGGLNYLRILSDHCKPEIMMMKSIYNENAFEETNMGSLLKLITEGLNKKMGIVTEITTKDSALGGSHQ